MLLRVAEWIVKRMQREQVIQEEDTDVYLYGVQLVLSTVLSFIIILLCGLISGQLLLSVLFLLCVVPLRMYCGGYHAKSYLKCDLVFLGCFFGNCIAYWLTGGLPVITFALGAIAALVICWFAPIENPNKPFTTKEGKRYRRISWGMVFVLYAASVTLFCIGWHPAAFMSWSLVVVAGLMLPTLQHSKH